MKTDRKLICIISFFAFLLPPMAAFSASDSLQVVHFDAAHGSAMLPSEDENDPGLAGTVRLPYRIAFKNNMLYDMTLVPNLGLEYDLGGGWSIGGNWRYAWWSEDKRHFYWRIYGGELDVRKYWDSRPTKEMFTGHYIGLYLQALTYDFEWGTQGYQSRFSYGGGLEYGYSFSLSRQFNLDLNIGIGYLTGRYKRYKPVDNHYVWQRTGIWRWFGPTKAEVSLVWLWRNSARKSKKGGAL